MGGAPRALVDRHRGADERRPIGALDDRPTVAISAGYQTRSLDGFSLAHSARCRSRGFSAYVIQMPEARNTAGLQP